MNISKWIYLFISLFVSTISCTHIQPKEKILIKIVYNNKIEEKFLEAVKAGFTEKYNAANKSNSYKTFDEVFKIKNISKDEFDRSQEDETKNIVCFFSNAPSRLEDFKLEPAKFEKKTITYANCHIIFTAFELQQFQQCGSLSQDSEKYKNNYSVFEVSNEQKGELKIMNLGAMIAKIKEAKAEEKLEKASAISWKQAGLLAGGVTVAALGAYLMMRYNNQKSIQSSLSLNTDKNNVYTTIAAHLLPAEATLTF